MKLWIDDVRPAPDGYEWYHSVNSAIERIIFCEEEINRFTYLIQRNILLNHFWIIGKNRRLYNNTIYENIIKNFTIELIDIDHDAGDYACDGGDYIKLLDWLEETGRNYPIHIHSMNPVGVQNMRTVIQKNGWKEV